MGVQKQIMKSCYIICGGPEPCKTVKIPHEAFVICADSGYDKALDAGITPNFILGDFDSLKSDLPDNIEIMRSPTHKDDTDTMLAVRTALERGYDSIVLVGACTGRTDHTIANIATLLFIREHGAKGFIKGDNTDAYILEDEKLTLAPDVSRYLSVFAISDKAVVSITGADYPLDGYVMERSFPIGVSNEFIENKECTVEAKSGLIVVMSVKK